MKYVQISLFDLIQCLSNTTDLVSPMVSSHQQRVAYIGSGIAAEMGLSKVRQGNVTLAGALHDFGALSLQERIECLNFEVDTPHQHSESAYLLLRDFDPFASIAEIIRHHHLPWDHGRGRWRFGTEVPIESHVIHCADRIAVLLEEFQGGMHIRERIREILMNKSGTLLHPDVCAAFFSLAEKSYFWFDLESPYLDAVIEERGTQCNWVIDLEELAEIGVIFGRAIDFRSRFTAVHSSGTAAVSEWLARQLGMTDKDCRLMNVAGHMHDFGKLAISRNILDKPGKLTREEAFQIQKHPFYAHRLLEPIQCLRKLNEWISFHHERLDGQGYPFRLHGKEIPLGARIMAVGDIFTALTEDRPYRAGMSSAKALQIMDEMVSDRAIDGDVLSILRNEHAEVEEIRRCTQRQAYADYEAFHRYLQNNISLVDQQFRFSAAS